jgi:type II secretory pathway pseudopilin PulG
MRALLAALLMILAATVTPVLAQDTDEVTTSDRTAIEQVIRGQIDAFRHDDASAAFAFAAPGAQERFGNAEMFLEAVRRGYQPVYRPHGVDFTTLSVKDGEIVQTVELIGPDGNAYTAFYTMEREVDGAWRIVACELIPSQRVGA